MKTSPPRLSALALARQAFIGLVVTLCVFGAVLAGLAAWFPLPSWPFAMYLAPVAAAAAAAVVMRAHGKIEQRAMSDRQASQRAERESEKQKQIDAMLRGNSNVPKVDRS